MSIAYSAAEIVDVAKQTERCGEVFYDAARRVVRHPEVQAVFASLARDEAAHARTFDELLERLRDPAARDLAPGSEDWRRDEEYVAYMRALAENRVFPSPEAVAPAVAKLGDEKDALRMAIQFEKDSILFLEGMRRAVRPADVAIIDELVTEETRHVAALQAVVARLPLVG